MTKLGPAVDCRSRWQAPALSLIRQAGSDQAGVDLRDERADLFRGGARRGVAFAVSANPSTPASGKLTAIASDLGTASCTLPAPARSAASPLKPRRRGKTRSRPPSARCRGSFCLCRSGQGSGMRRSSFGVDRLADAHRAATFASGAVVTGAPCCATVMSRCSAGGRGIPPSAAAVLIDVFGHAAVRHVPLRCRWRGFALRRAPRAGIAGTAPRLHGRR